MLRNIVMVAELHIRGVFGYEDNFLVCLHSDVGVGIRVTLQSLTKFLCDGQSAVRQAIL